MQILLSFQCLKQPEEDLILMWALLTGSQIDWAHLIRYRMKKALWANASLPYPHLITLFLEHFKIPLDNKPHILLKRSFSIGPGALYSFGYKKDSQNKWVRKKDAHIEEIDEGTPSPLLEDPILTMLNTVLTEIRDLRLYVGERFDAMGTRL